MGVWCRPVEANVNACVQTGLRGADRREMASTCYIAGPLLSPKLHDTHTQMYTLVWNCVGVCPCPLPPVLSSAHGGRKRDGCPLFSLPLLLSSSIQLLSHSLLFPHLSFDFFRHHLFCCSLLFSLHLSSSQLAYAHSSSSLSLSGCLSASASLLLISVPREETPAPSILFFSVSCHCYL